MPNHSKRLERLEDKDRGGFHVIEQRYPDQPFEEAQTEAGLAGLSSAATVVMLRTFCGERA